MLAMYDLLAVWRTCCHTYRNDDIVTFMALTMSINTMVVYRYIGLLLTLCFLNSLAFAKQIDASNSHFHYSGRIDFSSNQPPLIAWQGSTIGIEFTGEALLLGFSDLNGQVFFNITVDGQTKILKAKNGWITADFKLDKGKHVLQLFKRSEASGGTVNFEGIRIDNDAKISKPKAIPYDYRIIFYGDSITVGACNEDGIADQWEDLSTHNSARSYPAFVAKHFNADYRNISISGVGISIGYQPYTIDQTWNRFAANPAAQLASPQDFQPDIVFTNFGENDDSFTSNQKIAFPSDYVPRYLALLKSLRQSYPTSKIVILRGGMYGGKKSPRLIQPWQQVVKQAEAKDTDIYHYVFDHWYHLHPRVADHEKMATELIHWLENQKWLTADK